jgi:hypothetical protein
MSRLRKMSEKTAMNSQMAITQKSMMIIHQTTSQNVMLSSKSPTDVLLNRDYWSQILSGLPVARDT